MNVIVKFTISLNFIHLLHLKLFVLKRLELVKIISIQALLLLLFSCSTNSIKERASLFSQNIAVNAGMNQGVQSNFGNARFLGGPSNNFMDKTEAESNLRKNVSIRDVFAKNITFTQNNGQLERFYDIKGSDLGAIEYYSRNFGGTAYFMKKGIGFGFTNGELDEKAGDLEAEHHLSRKNYYKSINFNLIFENSNDNVEISASNKQVGIINYFKGPVEDHITNIASYEVLTYKGIYNNIDLTYYQTDTKLKYDYLVEPNGNVEDISMDYQGTKSVSINEQGKLEIETEWGILIDDAPYSYQMIDGKQAEVDVRYSINQNGKVGFQVMKGYDKSKRLVIDPPTMTWCSFAGHTTGDGYLMDVAVDDDGNVYGTGNYNSGFPTNSQTTFESNIHGGEDPFVFKLSADGQTMIYAGYVGGDGGVVNERGWGIDVNANGEAYITGHVSDASRFPFTNGVVQNTIGGGLDMFITKINAAGSAIEYSTFYGGSGDDRAYGIAVDSLGNAYVTGTTNSSSGFAIGAGIEQSTLGGAMDAFVLKLNADASAVDFCTYMGGTSDDLGRSIAVNNSGIYITGATGSSASIAKTGGFQTSLGGGSADAFICKFNSDGSQAYGTYIGGSNEDKGEDIAIKENGEAVIGGYTRSTFSQGFPSVNAVQVDNQGLRDAFVVRLNPDGSTVLNATFMGTAQEECLRNSSPFVLDPAQKSSGVDISSSGQIALVLTSATAGLPLVNALVSSPQGGDVGLGDCYLCVLSEDGDSILFSTYFGGTENDYATGGVKFSGADVYIAGSSHSTSLPTTAGVFQPTRAGGGDMPFVVKYSCLQSTVIEDIEDTTSCENFVFPVILGEFLTGDEAYYIDGSGAALNAGDSIFESDIIHLVDPANTCGNEIKFYVSIEECKDTIVDTTDPVDPVDPTDSCIFDIPNAFTPDGDQVNDVWNIACIDEYPNAEIRVFNRWGSLVHQTTGSAYEAWTGNDLPVGSYFYTIELHDSDVQVFKGKISLIR